MVLSKGLLNTAAFDKLRDERKKEKKRTNKTWLHFCFWCRVSPIENHTYSDNAELRRIENFVISAILRKIFIALFIYPL